MTRVALLRCDPLPEPDPDEAPLTRAFADLGAQAHSVPWRAAGDLSAYDAVVVRATWDYHHAPEAFADLLERAARESVLVNPLAVCLENLHKRYLMELPARGVPVVPTVCVERGQAREVDAMGWEEVVIKPAISCGSWRTRRVRASDPEAQAFFDGLVAERDVLVQPVMSGFEAPGERSLIWIDGEVTHGANKRPRFDGEAESTTPHHAITEAERAFAQAAVDTLPERPVFARVDVIDAPGGLVLSELEALEPSLFFRFAPAAAGVLARAVLARAGA